MAAGFQLKAGCDKMDIKQALKAGLVGLCREVYGRQHF
jgi:hypothetical protein